MFLSNVFICGMKVICNNIVPSFCLHVSLAKRVQSCLTCLVLRFSAVLVLLPSPKGTFRSSNQQDLVLLSNCIFYDCLLTVNSSYLQ
ncbi:hypothetical protein PAMP_004665 [Pampus punctatissimus]